MNKKGFTLIELMGVIVILLLVVMLVFPSIINIAKKANGKIDEVTTTLIISGVKEYVEANKNSYSSPTNVGATSTYCVSIQTLIDNNYLIEDLEDGTSGEKIDTTRGIEIKVSKAFVDGIEKVNYDFNILDSQCP